jgi:uncharacterized cupin superfamily protein
VVPEAPLEDAGDGLIPTAEGWFVVNAREASWRYVEGRGAYSDFEADQAFPQVGVHLVALARGEAMGMYHWEADQEDFLVLAGEALLIVEGEERPLRQWDFVHCPPRTSHIIVGAGDGTCLVLAVGARQHDGQPDALFYPADEVAQRHGVGVERGTPDAAEAYAGQPRREFMRYREGWLPGD